MRITIAIQAGPKHAAEAAVIRDLLITVFEGLKGIKRSSLRGGVDMHGAAIQGEWELPEEEDPIPEGEIYH